ncbi:MAG: MopE-related protein, partial [Myxococcota bacterium]|nr:MopE-related protein [Myxococcota bacterium]
DGEKPGTWCQPVTGSCECTEASEGTQRTCIAENPEGKCYGVETCDPEAGWVGCNAATPAAEVCDGLDNNCNALLDEGVQGGGDCSVDVEGVGSCGGVEVCLGAQGLVCQAGTPEIEACDFQDNDCDGSIDENFKDESGEWTLTGHCGTCGNDCTDKIPNGTGTCAAKEGTPICVVESCDEDYLALNDFQCALPPDVSCQPCSGDDACYDGSCIELDGQQVCVSPCGEEEDTCAEGYECADLGESLKRCVPITGSCVCSAATDGQTRTCAAQNDAGICFGEETCDASVGWAACTAVTPAEEICNGFDDNCNGAVDDGIVQPEEACVSANDLGTCTGLWYCGGPEGDTEWWCSAPEPAADVCDYLDNDCDGVADDPFKIEGTDAYVNDANCGACGISCDGAIPNADASCVYNEGLPRCEVAACDPGFYQAGPLTCLPSNDTLCAPCQAADNCGTPGDACVPLDGASYCGRDCSEGNLYGVPAGTCPPGFTCTDTEGGPQCQPDSGSCTCLPGDEGNVRTCSQETDAGLCFGQETCDPSIGWGGCTALVPDAEVCTQVDDDCDGSVDNVPGRGDACVNTNDQGACSGLLDCVPGEVDLVCVGATPAAEVCDYVDNNCDGNTDEAYPLVYEPCAMGDGLCTRFGFHECSDDGASVFCNAEAGEPDPESCDGLDNDCNGSTDELWPEVGDVCYAGEGACQAIGTYACAEGGADTSCTAVPGEGGDEACNYVDDDCDGATDEGYTNIATGLYDSDDACGSCFTDCTKVFDKPNSYGFCDVVVGEPTCLLGCEPGYFDMNNIPDDGCEFFLDPTTIFVSSTDEHAWDDAGCGLGPWVSAEEGTWPCRTISH